MESIEKYILKNNFKELKEYLLKFEHESSQLKNKIVPLLDDYGLIIIYSLIEVAYYRNIVFWFDHISFFLSFFLSHMDGAERISLEMCKKSFKIEPNMDTLRAILDFRNPPEIILTDSEYNYYSKLLDG